MIKFILEASFALLIVVLATKTSFAQTEMKAAQETKTPKSFNLSNSVQKNLNGNAVSLNNTPTNVSTETLYDWCRTYNVLVYAQAIYDAMSPTEKAIVDGLQDKIIYRGRELSLEDINRYKASISQ